MKIVFCVCGGADLMGGMAVVVGIRGWTTGGPH